MWAAPNGTTHATYTAEISYDGNAWRRLSLEHADSTFVSFSVTAQMPFQIRVTPQGGMPTTQTFTPQKSGAAAGGGTGFALAGAGGNAGGKKIST